MSRKEINIRTIKPGTIIWTKQGNVWLVLSKLEIGYYLPCLLLAANDDSGWPQYFVGSVQRLNGISEDGNEYYEPGDTK